MYVRIRRALPFVILAVVFSSCSPQASNPSEGTSQPPLRPEQQVEEDIARQWAEIEHQYPEASRVIAQALLYMSTPLPGEDEEFEYISAHHEWKLEIGQCANALLIAIPGPPICMVDLSEISPPEPGIVWPEGVQCIKECGKTGKPYRECVCECFPELCLPE